MVDSTMADGLDAVPMAILCVAQVLTNFIKLSVNSISRVTERRCVCTIRLIEAVHDLYKLRESFNWRLQF